MTFERVDKLGLASSGNRRRVMMDKAKCWKSLCSQTGRRGTHLCGFKIFYHPFVSLLPKCRIRDDRVLVCSRLRLLILMTVKFVCVLGTVVYRFSPLSWHHSCDSVWAFVLRTVVPFYDFSSMWWRCSKVYPYWISRPYDGIWIDVLGIIVLL